MASKDFASVAAATAGGYALTQTDKGASFLPASLRWTSVFDKPVVGEPNAASGSRLEATGQGSTSAASLVVALAALNNLRLHRYGADTTLSTGPHGTAYVTDIT